MAYALNRNQRIYLQIESTFGVAPNSSGTATVAGTNCCLITKATFKPIVDTLRSESKTGTRTVPAGVGGRRHGTFSITMELRPNGAAGVKPDFDPLMQAIFGQAGVIVASTSVTYSLSDAIVSFTAYSFRTPSSVAQQVAAGCVVTNAKFNLGENIATVTFTGVCYFVADTFTFSSLDTAGKLGLTAIPSEPSSPTTNGPIVAGFTGGATVDGNLLANLRTAEIDIGINNDIPLDVFGSYYGGTPEGDARDIGLTMSTYDDDSTGTSNMYAKALTKTPINATMQIGTVSGSILTFTVKGIQLETPDLTEGQRKFQANFARSRASGSSLTAKDELTAVFT